MRLYFKLSKNKELIPFNYQPFLTGAIHKWIGENNEVHDALSLYSFSWLQHVEVRKDGVNLTANSYFFISAYHETLIKQILKGVLAAPSFCFGSSVADVQIAEAPRFSAQQVFSAASPVFIKRRINENEKHITHDDPASGAYLTETLQKKLGCASFV